MTEEEIQKMLKHLKDERLKGKRGSATPSGGWNAVVNMDFASLYPNKMFKFSILNKIRIWFKFKNFHKN